MVAPAGERSRVRSSLSFAASACFHSWVLGWVILGGAATPERRKSIYDQEIRPNEKKLIWYSLRDKLPEISPPDAASDARPPRAREKAPQTMVSGKTDDAQPSQLIWSPAPEVAAPKATPLPNVIAVAPPPKLVRPFVAPPIEPPPVTTRARTSGGAARRVGLRAQCRDAGPGRGGQAAAARFYSTARRSHATPGRAATSGGSHDVRRGGAQCPALLGRGTQAATKGLRCTRKRAPGARRTRRVAGRPGCGQRRRSGG